MCAQPRWPIEVMVEGSARRLRQSVAGRFDDRFVGFEHAVGEPVLAQVLPDVLDRIELGGARGQEDEGDVFRHDRATGRMPAGPIEEEHGVGASPEGGGIGSKRVEQPWKTRYYGRRNRAAP